MTVYAFVIINTKGSVAFVTFPDVATAEDYYLEIHDHMNIKTVGKIDGAYYLNICTPKMGGWV